MYGSCPVVTAVGMCLFSDIEVQSLFPATMQSLSVESFMMKLQELDAQYVRCLGVGFVGVAQWHGGPDRFIVTRLVVCGLPC